MWNYLYILCIINIEHIKEKKMKLEFKILIYSMINNLAISIIKVVGGILFGLSSLFADGMHTFSDFVTDIVCLIGAKISKKKTNKKKK